MTLHLDLGHLLRRHWLHLSMSTHLGNTYTKTKSTMYNSKVFFLIIVLLTHVQAESVNPRIAIFMPSLLQQIALHSMWAIQERIANGVLTYYFFQARVQALRTSGNQDGPEGGFDGFLQAIVCQQVCTIFSWMVVMFDNLLCYLISSISWQLIGWRTNARRLLLYISDAGFHFAGDGKVLRLFSSVNSRK